MTQFIIGIIVLIVGFFTYGAFINKLFGADENIKAPAYTMQDGVDYVPLPTWKVFLIQVLNVVGLGPIYGGIQGALFGSSAFIWIALGCVFAGAVHDYFSGMMSVRSYGSSISEVAGDYLGNTARQVMRVFSVILLALTGTVFMTGPADILASLTHLHFLGLNSFTIWLLIIFAYYILATIVSIDKIIGKIYPVLGIALLIMAIGVGANLIIQGYQMPSFSFANRNPSGNPIWAMLFTTIACGAISGFHSTQSPMMARCIKSEKYGHLVFYGAMITEGIIAMVWASAASAYFHGIPQLGRILSSGTPAKVVTEISYGLMGPIGGVLAVLGVVACPITSGDTAFRAVRLNIADALKLDQRPLKNRLVIAIPLFVFIYFLSQMNFSMIWRYFAFSNQTLATIVLWTATAFLINHNKNFIFTYLPACFMTFVCSTYILEAPEGFRLGAKIGTIAGAAVAIIIIIFMTLLVSKAKGKTIIPQKPKKI